MRAGRGLALDPWPRPVPDRKKETVDRDSESRIAELELENSSLEEDVERLTREVEGLKSQLDDKDRLIVEAQGNVARAVSDLRDVIQDLVT